MMTLVMKEALKHPRLVRVEESTVIPVLNALIAGEIGSKGVRGV